MGRDGVAGLLLLALSILLTVQAREIPRTPFLPLGADFFPRVLLVILAAGSLLLLTLDILRHRQKAVPGEGVPRFREVPRSIPAIFVVFAVYVFLMPMLGFALATVLFVAAAQILLGPHRPRDFPRIALVAVGTATLTHLIFERYLHVFLPRGVLF